MKHFNASVITLKTFAMFIALVVLIVVFFVLEYVAFARKSSKQKRARMDY